MAITYRSVLGSDGETKYQEKTATPYTTAQTIIPDDGYDGLSKVNIEPIHYLESVDMDGSISIFIGTIAPTEG